MADTTTLTCTEKRGNVAGDAYEPGTVYTRTFTFPVLASATGYGASDILNLITIPANTQILGLAMSASVAQSTGATFTFQIDSGSALSAALAPTTAAIFFPSAITAANAASGVADGTLKAVIGTQTCDAATITVTLTCCALGSAAAPFTTYTN
jgi:hypothetical protein